MRFDERPLSEVLEHIALGNCSAGAFALVLLQELQALQKREQSSLVMSKEKVSPLVITGHENLAINYGSCCCPIPGDAILGVLIPGEGVYVHRKKCMQLKELQSGGDIQPIDVEWGDAIRHSFSAHLELYALNQKGTLATIAVAVARDSVNISDVHIISKDENTACVNLTLIINDRNQLSRIVRRLRREKCILHIKRVIGDENDID